MTLIGNDLRALVADSAFIFVGRLLSRDMEKDARGLLVTRNRFAVERVIVGQPDVKTITLTVLGGETDTLVMRVSHMPEFAVDQRYIVFTDLARTVYNPVTANEHGVFVIADTAVYAYDGRAVTGVENGILQFGATRLDIRTGRVAETSASSDAAKLTGNIVSMERAPAAAENPVRLEEFIAVIAAAARR